MLQCAAINSTHSVIWTFTSKMPLPQAVEAQGLSSGKLTPVDMRIPLNSVQAIMGCAPPHLAHLLRFDVNVGLEDCLVVGGGLQCWLQNYRTASYAGLGLLTLRKFSFVFSLDKTPLPQMG